jgi:F0F1-type ATP synthase epsilon subunit
VLGTGAVTVDGVDGSRTTIAVNGGFLQVLDNVVTLLTDRATVVDGDGDAARAVAAGLGADEG